MKIVSRLFWLVLFLAFLAFGLNVHGRVAADGLNEVFGFDYAAFMAQMRDARWITYTGFRHPALGLLLSPVVLLAAALDKIDQEVCDRFVVGVMALVGVLNVWLVRKVAGWFAAAVFLTFGFTWFLAAVPESFPFAMTSLLAVALLCRGADSPDGFCDEGKDASPSHYGAWAALALVATAITVTNGLKVAVAFAICNWRAIRAARVRLGARDVPLWAILAAGGVAFALAVAGLFAARMAAWNSAHPDDPKSVAMALTQTMSWIPQGLGFWGRLKGAAVGFATVPLLPPFAFDGLEAPPPPSVAGFVWGLIWIVWAVAGAVVCWRMKMVRAIVGMFAVDAAIHIVCGWGLNEGWIFCGHWFWMVPVIVGLSLKRRSRA